MSRTEQLNRAVSRPPIASRTVSRTEGTTVSHPNRLCAKGISALKVKPAPIERTAATAAEPLGPGFTCPLPCETDEVEWDAATGTNRRV